MKIENKEKQILKVAILAILFYFAMLRFDAIMAVAAMGLAMAKPFIIGGVLAFIINVPMKKVEALLGKTGLKKGRRPLAFLLTLVMIIAAVACFLLIVVPQLAQAITTLVARLQIIVDGIPAFIDSHSHNLTIVEEWLTTLEIDWQAMGQNIINYLKNFVVGLVGSGTGIITGFVSGFTTFLFAFIFAIYLVLGKEKIGAALTDLTCALFPAKISSPIFHVLAVSNKTFSSFLSGQCLEAVILGTMFVVAMSLLGMPYAFLIGIIIGVTALIPVFGAFIGCFVGIVLIALESPVQALWFVALFLLLQQIEGNLIYPYVVGGSIGLPSVLVFMSVIIGGDLMGVLGMLIFIPSVSVAYTLIKEFVLSRKALSQPPEPEEQTETTA